MKKKCCSNCGIDFKCTQTEGDGSCWCDAFPPLFQPDASNDCLCPACLKEATLKKIEVYTAAITPEEAVNNKAQDLPKSMKLLEDIDFYKENNRFVFTKWYLLKRGFCCKNGCRHCPYR